MEVWTIWTRKYWDLKKNYRNCWKRQRKRRNVLEEQEIQSFFADDHLDEDKWDAVYDFLDANKIDVLRVGNDPDMDPGYV